MQRINHPAPSQFQELCRRPLLNNADIASRVQPLLEAVKISGDAAVRAMTKTYDHIDLLDIEVSAGELKHALESLSTPLKEAILLAIDNIEKFHRLQLPSTVMTETTPGVLCWQKAVPINSVGLYVPGGSAPLFSTVLMLAIPARIAGCQQIIMCSPPQADGHIDRTTLAAAELAGVHRIFKVGGAQAIAAMAYGTKTIPKVDKIFGPGNQYVTAAKQLVQQEGIAIDLPAGPSEVLVWAGQGAKPEFVAADLLSQAEHGADSQVVLITEDEVFAERVQAELSKQLLLLPRQEVARQALTHSRIIVLQHQSACLEFINQYAPEHLIIADDQALALSDGIQHAGSVFLGHFTPEAAGDYASGTNHTLPTNGFARAYSGVNIDAYLKKITFQSINAEGVINLGPAVVSMAQAEQLEAHALAMSLRLDHLKTKQ